MTRPLEPGLVIDGFRLDEKVHEGGMAALWRVSRAPDDPPMVMKIPFQRPGEGPEMIISFEVEQMILPRLSGPHVPRFVAASRSLESPYLVMEYVAGRGLEERQYPYAEVATIGAKVAIALHDLHRQHVIHHDVNPSNVIIRDDGEAVLIDLGLAWHEQLPDLLAEETRLPIGTYAYLSPEQVRANRREPRSDIFALGIMLYVMTTGEYPFGNPQRSAGTRRRLWRDPIPPRQRNLDCPEWLQEIILHCLEVGLDKRYRTAAQVAFDLQHPDQVTLTARARRMRRDGYFTALKRRLQAIGAEPPASLERETTMSSQLGQAFIIMAAVDLSPDQQVLSEALRVNVEQALRNHPGARLVCVNVLKQSLVAIDRTEDEQGRSLYVQRLVELKHWGQSFGLALERVSCHVLEAVDVAGAIIDYARNNQVDVIIIGARGASALRRYLGSVSAQVVAEAPCTVTVVRAGREGL